MKKLLTLALTGAMLLSCAVSVFADDSAGLTLAEGSHLKVENGIVDMIDGAITVGELKAEFAGAVDVAGKADDAAVCADDVVTAGGESAKAIIWGDASKDGKITLTDATRMLQSIAKWSVDISATAGDVDRNDKLTLADVSKLLQKLAKWDNISLGNVRMVFENKKLTAEAEDADIDLYFGSSMVKLANSNTKNTGMNSYKMKLAKNEVESCQFYLVSNVDKEGITAEISPFEYEFGGHTLEGELLREYYYHEALFNDLRSADHTNHVEDYFPEPLLPNDVDFELAAGKAQGFMMNVRSDEDAPAGMYKATLSIKDSDGKVIKAAAVYAYVWDFTLPETPYSASAFGLDARTIYGTLKMYDGDDMKTYSDYYEFLLDYKITPSEIPYDILDDRSDEYMNDPRVTSFRTMPELGGYAYTDFFGEGNIGAVGEINKNWDVEATEKKLVDTMAKVSSNPLWAYKSYFTIMDEPWDIDGYNRIKNVDDWMKGLLGDTDFNLMLCMAGNGVYSDAPFVDLCEFVKPYLDIWCPQSHAYTDYFNIATPGKQQWQIRQSYRIHGLYKDRLVNDLMDEGDRAWWYVCCSPEFPYPNYFKSYQGIGNRVLLWQQYMFDIEGILYWSTNADWDKINKRESEASDGQLLYWGELYGLKGPVASFRLTQIRDSFDDFDYLKMAEEAAGREAVDKILSTVTTASLEFTEDPNVMEAARDALAELIIDEQGK